MTTSNKSPIPTSSQGSDPVLADRLPLRMQMAPDGTGTLAGAWWPQTRDLEVELADLVDHFPPDLGRVDRAVFSPPDWDPAPRRIPVARGFLKVGSFPRDDTHVIELRLSGGQTLTVLVVPSTMSTEQAEDVMRVATTANNQLDARTILGAGRS